MFDAGIGYPGTPEGLVFREAFLHEVPDNAGVDQFVVAPFLSEDVEHLEGMFLRLGEAGHRSRVRHNSQGFSFMFGLAGPDEATRAVLTEVGVDDVLFSQLHVVILDASAVAHRAVSSIFIREASAVFPLHELAGVARALGSFSIFKGGRCGLHGAS